MKKIDELISRLKEAKEELLKNQNMSYSGATNTAAPGMSGALDKQDSPEKVDKEMRAVAEKGEGREHDDSNDKEPELKGPDKGGAKRDQPKVEKAEMCKVHPNGQWEINKAMTAQDIRDGMAGARGGGAGYKPAAIAKPIGKAEEALAPAVAAPSPAIKPQNVARPDKGHGAIILKDESPTKC